MPVPEPLNVRSVLVLKSDRLYAEVLRQFSLRVFPKARVRLVATIEAAESVLDTQGVDLLITGVGASLEGDVLDLLTHCTKAPRRAQRILVVTARCDYRVLASLHTLDADGVFDSVADAPEQLMAALRAMADGTRYWSPTFSEKMKRTVAARDSLFGVLTAFEQVILSVVGDGSDDFVAARELGLSPATVATVRRDLHRKLGVQHRGELVRIAAQHGFVRFTPSGVVRPGFALLAAAYQARKSRRGPGRRSNAAPDELCDSDALTQEGDFAPSAA